MKKYTCIDLFAGAGGLSLGFKQTNRFDILAHIEWEKPMVDTLRNDMALGVKKLLKCMVLAMMKILQNLV